jgi:hypothetical protein
LWFCVDHRHSNWLFQASSRQKKEPTASKDTILKLKERYICRFFLFVSRHTRKLRFLLLNAQNRVKYSCHRGQETFGKSKNRHPSTGRTAHNSTWNDSRAGRPILRRQPETLLAVPCNPVSLLTFQNESFDDGSSAGLPTIYIFPENISRGCQKFPYNLRRLQ